VLTVADSWIIYKKLNKIEALLKYADIQKFVRYVTDARQENIWKSRVFNIPFIIKHKEDLSIIEKAFADEVTFLFYLNLLKKHGYTSYDNNNGYVIYSGLITQIFVTA
jgi:hypothetical protein